MDFLISLWHEYTVWIIALAVLLFFSGCTVAKGKLRVVDTDIVITPQTLADKMDKLVKGDSTRALVLVVCKQVQKRLDLVEDGKLDMDDVFMELRRPVYGLPGISIDFAESAYTLAETLIKKHYALGIDPEGQAYVDFLIDTTDKFIERLEE